MSEQLEVILKELALQRINILGISNVGEAANYIHFEFSWRNGDGNLVWSKLVYPYVTSLIDGYNDILSFVKNFRAALWNN